MDIGSGKGYPSSALSNFSPHPFIFDGVQCASMEGLLQAFKFENPQIQVEVCKLVGLAAKQRGQKRNKAWQRVQRLWWNGVAYARDSKEYQDLLTRAFDALSENSSFQKALLATGKAKLTHEIGKSDKSQTVLTKNEFCSQLNRLRLKLLKLQAENGDAK